jgi:hypothetical protein
MPFKSKAQNAWAHTPAGTKALGGSSAVKEWEGATDYSHLPSRVGHAKGGIVKQVDQDTGDHIPKGEPFHHKRMAGGGGNPRGGIGGHNDGHGVYGQTTFAQGGPALKEGNDKHYKSPTRNDFGQFLGTKDRFTDGRMPANFPVEADTEEDWTKPKGVGHKEADDFGDTKCLKPILPHTKEGHYDYTANRQEDEPGSPHWRKDRIS